MLVKIKFHPQFRVNVKSAGYKIACLEEVEGCRKGLEKLMLAPGQWSLATKT